MTVATPGPLPPPPPRRGGCLSGCLIALGIVVVLIAAGAGFGWWYLQSGYKNNETLKAAIVAVNNDMGARAMLGDHVEITSLSSSNFSTDTTNGTVESYVANVKGSRAEGSLAVNATTPPHGQRHFTKMELTGPGGQKYEIGGGGGDQTGNGGI